MEGDVVVGAAQGVEDRRRAEQHALRVRRFDAQGRAAVGVDFRRDDAVALAPAGVQLVGQIQDARAAIFRQQAIAEAGRFWLAGQVAVEDLRGAGDEVVQQRPHGLRHPVRRRECVEVGGERPQAQHPGEERLHGERGR